MSFRLLLSTLAVIGLVVLIAWAEVANWQKLAALEQRLARPERGPLAAEVRETLRGFRGWLIASSAGMLVLVLVLGRTVQREMIAPLERRLVETHAVLARQEKLAALGVLAAGVAHEIRNPLTAIKARLFSQKKRLPPGSPELHDADLIKGEIDRLEQIVKDFLLFARPSEPAWQELPAIELLHRVAELVRPELEVRGTALRVDAPDELRVRLDPAQIRQVLLNLIRNAAESLGSGGTVTLRARPTYLPFAPQRTEAVALEVEDDGPGIPSEVQQRLFDPFFTTKETGTGLGLAIAERITEKHGGTLQFRTRAPSGAVFTVILPAGAP
jgi:signal transduction histidine kinase